MEMHGWKVFWKRMLRRIFGSERLEIIYNEDIRNPYYAANIIRIVSSKKMRWAGPVGCMG
jgi:hypothetical protein